MDHEVAKTLGELERKLQDLERELTSIGRRGSVPMTQTVRGPSEDPSGEQPVKQPSERPEPIPPFPSAPPAPPTPPTPSTPPAFSPPQPAAPASVGGDGSFKLVDEAVEALDPQGSTDSAYESAIADSDKFGSPAVFGGEEVPAQARETPVGDWGASRETAFGEIPTDPGDPSAQAPVTSPSAQGSVMSPSARAPKTFPSADLAPAGVRDFPDDATRRSVDVADLIRFRDKLVRTVDELIDEYNRLLSLHDSRRRSHR